MTDSSNLDALAEYREQGRAEPAGSKRSQASRLVAAAIRSEVRLWHDTKGSPWASFTVNGHNENWGVRSTEFKVWLQAQFHQQEGTAAGTQALQNALDVLAGKASYDGPLRSTHIRLAEADGKLYLDLADQEWRAVEISSENWTVMSDPPIMFRRSAAMKSLPLPTRGGDLGRLRQYFNVRDEDDWILIASWLLAAMRPTGPYPVLVLYGEQGSAKSTTARLLRSLVDPNAAPLRSAPRDVARELMIATTHSWVMAYDNLSHLSQDFSDAICRLSTGGGQTLRKLYTDTGEIVIDAERPVILNGIEELAGRSDLLDRALIIQLPQVSRERRRSERELWAAFESDRPEILGALLDVVVHCMATVAEVQIAKSPRMADFARWATAAEPSLGLPPGRFLSAYAKNQEEINLLALESSSIAEPLRRMPLPWKGTATELLSHLSDIASDEERYRGWPPTARALSGQLRRIVPNLRAIGIEVEFGERLTTRIRERMITVRAAP